MLIADDNSIFKTYDFHRFLYIKLNIRPNHLDMKSIYNFHIQLKVVSQSTLAKVSVRSLFYDSWFIPIV